MAGSYERLNNEEDIELHEEQVLHVEEEEAPATVSEEMSMSEDAVAPGPPSLPEAAPSGAPETQGKPNKAAMDGVFANLSSPPELPPKYDDSAEELPNYGQVDTDDVTTTEIVFTSAEEIYVDNKPVGSILTFMLTLSVTLLFHLVGFLASYLLTSSHAGRNGAKAGLALLLVQFGSSLRAEFYRQLAVMDMASDETDSYDSYYENYEYTEEQKEVMSFTASWLSLVFIFGGWLLFAQACTSYINARRMQQITLTA